MGDWILFSMFPFALSHHSPTFRIARTLTKLGHTVAYLTTLDNESAIRSRGFEFVPFFSDLYPKDWAAALTALPRDARRAERLMRLEQRRARFVSDVESILRAVSPSLVIGDAGWEALCSFPSTLVARKLGIPTLHIRTSYPNARQPGTMPFDSTLFPPRTRQDQLRCALEWRRAHRARKADVERGIIESPHGFDQICLQCGVPSAAIRRTFLMREIVDTPTVILAPRELDFPCDRASNIYYAESSVEATETNSHAFPWERIPSEKRLIVFCLGTHQHLYGKRLDLFGTMLRVMASRPNDFLVLVAGDQADELVDVPPNVLPIRWAPQLELLKRASLMITHGGLGTIKESILAGVPMVVVPQAFDQKSNGARVEYHSLGAMLPEEGASSVEYVNTLIDRVLTTPSIERSVKEMQRSFQHHEHAQPSVALIEASLRDRPQSLRPRPSGHAKSTRP